MKASTKVATTVCVACVAISAAVSGIATASGATTESAPQFSSASELAALHTSGLKAATLADRDSLARLLPDNRTDAFDLTPLSTDLRTSDSGRHLEIDGTHELSVVPTVRGDSCYVASAESRTVVQGCIQDIPATGVWAGYQTANDGSRDQVVALVASDVSSVTISTNDGESQEARIVDGAFWWTAESADQHIVGIDAVRAGKHVTETDLFKVDLNPGEVHVQ